jgi:hypothetical protein
MASRHTVDVQHVPAPDVVSTGPDDASVAPRPEFLDHEGLARQLSCSVTTIHKLRRERVLGEPCQIGSLVRWHWPTVRAKILATAVAARQPLSADAGDPFFDRLNGSTE